MTIDELPVGLFPVAAPFFAGTLFEQAMIGAVFEGRQPGRIFVDDARRPIAALLCRAFGCYIAGDLGAAGLRRFIADAPAEAEVFARLSRYMPLDAAWVPVLLADHRGRLVAVERRAFRVASSNGTENPPKLSASCYQKQF